MPLGFDEFRAIELENWISDEADVPHVPFASINFPYELFLRSRDSGAWQWFEGIRNYAKDERGRNSVTGYHAHFVDPLNAHSFTRVDKWLSRLKQMASIPDPNSHFFIPPGLWTPKIQLEQKIGLTTAIPNVLQAIATQRKSLAEIPWRDLEEIVAELLRASGLEVFLTKRSRDGGSDIIARGELVPGEPTLLAVEVKQKPTVGIHDVQRALAANEDFPALMIATAGRFSGGVIRQRQRHRNQLRLFLKDGVALRQWINAYNERRG